MPQKETSPDIIENSIKVYIDPGHCGTHDYGDPGAVGGTTTESEIVLIIAKELRNLLRLDRITPILSRDTNDVKVPLNSRIKQCNQLHCDYLVSIHCNSSENKKASGFETIVYKGTKISMPYAIAIHNSLINFLPNHKNRGIIGDVDATTNGNSLGILKYTNCPACLVELEFISNPSQEQDLIANYRTYAKALYEGITDYIVSLGVPL